MKAKVSVIIPAYNSLSHLERCINSILCQSYKNIEIVVIDDGSTDGTSEFVKAKYSNKINLHRQKNSGVSVARNFGIAVSDGEYIIFADADDEFEKDAIRKAVECIERHEVDVLRFSYKEKYANIVKKVDMKDVSEKSIVFDNAENMQLAIDLFFGEKAYMKCLVMTLMIKRSLLNAKTIAFDPKLYMMEDVVFYADLIKAGAKFYFLNEPLYIYYQNENSVSHDSKKRERIIRGVLDANNKIEKRFRNNSTINNRHFRIVIGLVVDNCLSTGQIIYNQRIKRLAEKTSFSKGSASGILRYALIKNKKKLFGLIVRLKATKRRKTQKEELI